MTGKMPGQNKLVSIQWEKETSKQMNKQKIQKYPSKFIKMLALQSKTFCYLNVKIFSWVLK